MEKAIHEAKVHTSWVNPNEAYEAAVAALRGRRAGPRTQRRRSWPTCARFARAAGAARLLERRWPSCC